MEVLLKKEFTVLSRFERVYGDGGYHHSEHLCHDIYVVPPHFKRMAKINGVNKM